MKDFANGHGVQVQINFGEGSALGRCNAILPAEDVLFAAANTKLQQLSPGDTSLAGLKAKRPLACSSVSSRDVLDVLVAE